jgi:flagellar biosynthesis protein FlhF
MHFHRFVAKDSADAVEQIRAELGPEAVVAQVRRVAAKGLANLWGGTTLEVLACVPAQQGASDPLAPPLPPTAPALEFQEFPPGGGERHGLALLERLGLTRMNAERVWETSRLLVDGNQPDNLGAEVTLLKRTLSQFWKNPTPQEASQRVPEIFLGPPGAGSTTVLCKLLVQEVLARGRKVSVWRLDGTGPNYSERLALQCEMLGVPMLRDYKQAASEAECEQAYVDMPGVPFRDPDAVQRIGAVLKSHGQSRVHLCLNAAYSTPVLVDQFRAFAALPISDLVFTHLDEERSWGKLWNFVVGTHLPIRWLSAGQNVPGELRVANPALLLETAFRR